MLDAIFENVWFAGDQFQVVDLLEAVLVAIFLVVMFLGQQKNDPSSSWNRFLQNVPDCDSNNCSAVGRALKDIEAYFAARRMENVLKTWDQISSKAHATEEVFQMVVLAYVKCHRNMLVDAVVRYIERVYPENYVYRSPGPRAGLTNAVVEALAMPSRRRDSLAFCGIDFFEQVFHGLFRMLQVRFTARSYEAFFSALMVANDTERLEKVFRQVANVRHLNLLSGKGYAIAAQCYLRSSNLTKALEYLNEAAENGVAIPKCTISALIKNACDGDIVEDFFFGYIVPKQSPQIAPEATSAVLRYAYQKDNLQLLERVHQWVRDGRRPLLYSGHDTLLKCYTKMVGYEKGRVAFDEKVAAGFKLSERTCSSVLIICSETKNVKMVEHVFRYFRITAKSLCLRICSTMMKVYGNVGSFSQACALYELAKEHNVDPDGTM